MSFILKIWLYYFVTHSPPQRSKNRAATTTDDDWKIGMCSKPFSEDVKNKNGAKWLQCSFWMFSFHKKCQNTIVIILFTCATHECHFMVMQTRIDAGMSNIILLLIRNFIANNIRIPTTADLLSLLQNYLTLKDCDF